MFTKERLIELHADTFKKTREILVVKNNDYCGGQTSVDPFANFRSAEFFGVAPELGLMLRMGEDIHAQHSGLNLTARVLRRLTHMPVKQVPERLERLCA